MKNRNLYIALLITAVALISACKKKDDEKSPFDNAVYIQQAEKQNSQTINLKDRDVTLQRTLQAALAYPQTSDVTVEYVVDPSLVDKYNQTYSKSNIILPSKYYSLKSAKVTVAAGEVTSGIASQAVIDFSSMNEIPRNVAYILPVKMNLVSGDIKVLEASRIYYYIIQKGAPITVVADITSNFLTVPAFDKGTAANVNNLTQITIEALVKGDDWDSKGKIISTVMGIEGYFLIRIGDGGGYPAGQVQFAGSAGNFPAADPTKALKKGEWNHIAITYNKATNIMTIYVNGVQQSTGTRTFAPATINLSSTTSKFFIGKSYDNERDLRGQISECRIWSKVRTQTEIKDNMYELDPNSDGLQAYWKFDEGSGVDVKDYSKNGYNAKADGPLKWVPVSLP